MAFPTFQAVGTIEESATAVISPSWPTHQAGDIGLLIVESIEAFPIQLATSQGFREVPASPRGAHVKASSGAVETQLAVFWKRATSGAEPDPVVHFFTGQDHLRGCIATIRGCHANGCPFTVSTGAHEPNSAATSITVPGFTTITADQLIVVIGSNGRDIGTQQFSSMTNASLANITERIDSNSVIGGGSGIGMYTGEKATAGTVNDSVVNVAAGQQLSGIAIAFTAVEQPDDSTPWLCGIGDFVVSAGGTGVSVPWPVGVETGDIGLLIGESETWPLGLDTASGFVEVPDSPQNAGTSGAITASNLAVFWARAASGAPAAPVIDEPGDHVGARIVTFRGCAPTGDPWDVTAGNNNNGAADTSVTIPGDTTTVPETLIVAICSGSNDVSFAHFSGWANTGLDNLIERVDESNQTGAGSQHVVVVGRKLTAGSFGSTTGVIDTATNQGRIMLALKAATTALREILAEAGIFTIAGQDAAILRARQLAADAGIFTIDGQDAVFAIIVAYTLQGDVGEFTIEGQPVTMEKLFGRWRKRDQSIGTGWTKQPPEE